MKTSVKGIAKALVAGIQHTWQPTQAWERAVELSTELQGYQMTMVGAAEIDYEAGTISRGQYKILLAKAKLLGELSACLDDVTEKN